MAHVARVDERCVVQEVHVINNDDLPNDGAFLPEVEQAANDLQHGLGLAGKWLMTSYNGNFRGKYAGVGDRYDAETDTFVSPTPAE